MIFPSARSGRRVRPRRPIASRAARKPPATNLSDLDERPTLDIVNTFPGPGSDSATRARRRRPCSRRTRRWRGRAAARRRAAVLCRRRHLRPARPAGRGGMRPHLRRSRRALIMPILAGGDMAFLRAAEGAEDDEAAAIATLHRTDFPPPMRWSASPPRAAPPSRSPPSGTPLPSAR